MTTDNNIAFLDSYKHLEYITKMNYFPNSSDNSNIIGRLINLKAFKAYKEDINYLRVIRNFLTHNPKVNGDYPLYVSNGVIAMINNIINIIENPPTAQTICVLKEKIMLAHMYSGIKELLKNMSARGYSHVPLIIKNKVAGVFSNQSIIDYLTDESNTNDLKDMTIQDVLPYVFFQKTDEKYTYIKPETGLFEINEILENKRKIPTKKNYAVIFVTHTGDANGKLIGMITPWDVLIKLQK